MSKLMLAVVLASAAPSTALVLSQAALFSRAMPTSLISSTTTSSSSSPGQLSVNGEAIIAVTPDRATMRFQLQATATDKLEAQRLIDDATAKLLEDLSAAGAKRTELKSGAMQLQPNYARDHRGQPIYLKVESWQATRVVTACAHDLDLVTPWQKAARAAGAITVGEVELESSRLQELKEEARIQAATAARKKAVALASALGGRLGAPVSISESASSTNDASTYKRANAASDLAEDIIVTGDFAAGTLSVVANVAVTFVVHGDA